MIQLIFCEVSEQALAKEEVPRQLPCIVANVRGEGIGIGFQMHPTNTFRGELPSWNCAYMTSTV